MGGVLLALVGVAFAVAALWQRDTTHMNRAVELLGPLQRALQATLDASGSLPLRLPDTGADGKSLPTRGFVYLPADEVRTLRAFDGPVMLGFAQRVGTGLRTSGRAVLNGGQSQCRVQWLTDSEFAEWKAKQENWVQRRQREQLERGPRLP